jgi:predicted GIY-YIG superfamily endonuclease
MADESFVYLLVSSSGKATYVGATIDVDRRLQQHNGHLSGGAHATHAKVARGETWERVCFVSGFPNWQAALQFEWRWKQITRKTPTCKNPVERRIQALKTLLSLDRPTTKAMAYSEWDTIPMIHWNEKYECLG